MYADTNPILRDFWTNLRKNDSPFHVFKKNRNLVYFGSKMAEASHDFLAERMNRLQIPYNLNGLNAAFFQIMMKEQGHNEQLKTLAIHAVQQVFDIPDDLLHANLNEDADVELNESTKDRNYDYESLSKELKDQINKRILMNLLTQGASIHTFYTLHHVVRNELDVIDENLVKLYDKFTAGSVMSYYHVDYSELVGNEWMAKNGAVGSVKVEYDDDTPKVIANAKSFPVLCQELVKGAMETISLHGLQDLSAEDLDTIYYFADAIVDEPRYIQIGSQMWRYILKANRTYETSTLSHFLMNISLMTPESIESFFEELIETGSV